MTSTAPATRACPSTPQPDPALLHHNDAEGYAAIVDEDPTFAGRRSAELRRYGITSVRLTAVALEAFVYQTTTLLVGRRRPEGVEQMDWGLADGSFPSGHVGSATTLMVVLALLAWSGGPPGRAWAVSSLISF